MLYTLEMRLLNDDGEPTGSPVELAEVDTDADRVAGPLADTVSWILRMESVRIGLAGESIPMLPTRAWLVAYALTRANGALQAAGYQNPGQVVALDADGQVIPMPVRYFDNFVGCIVDPREG